MVLKPGYGQSVGSTQPVFSLGRPADADNNLIGYEIQVFGDTGLLTFIQSTAEPWGENSQIDWMLENARLRNNTTYFWRTRSLDSITPGPWSDTLWPFEKGFLPNHLPKTFIYLAGSFFYQHKAGLATHALAIYR